MGPYMIYANSKGFNQSSDVQSDFSHYSLQMREASFLRAVTLMIIGYRSWISVFHLYYEIMEIKYD